MLNKIIATINSIKKDNIIVAIDGRCGGGKTTIANELSKFFDCNVIHMDDFFLRPHQRTDERLGTPGENIDHERFLQEVLKPLSKGERFSYQPFRCKNQTLGDAITVETKPITIIEGSYSHHPKLRGYYDICIFVDVSYDEQIKRITLRNGEGAQMFKDKWIPLEERYFAQYSVKENADIAYIS